MHEIGEAARSIVMTLTLATLIEGVSGARIVGDGSVIVRAVRGDSREVEAGDVFVATRGLRADGHEHVGSAIERGAVAVVVERQLAVTVPQVVVGDSIHALGVLTGRAFGNPAQAMTLIGVTGTNGKTTTTYLVESILSAAGHRVGVIGTVELRWPGTRIAASYTTPTPWMLHDALARMRDAGCTHVVMEVTSIALAARRVAGVMFEVAAFSNLTQDHLDFHGTMASYRDAKAALFAHYLTGTAVVNVDDPAGEGMATAASGHRVLRVSTRTATGDIRVAHQDSTVRGITARLATPRGELAITARPLIGHYNVDNIALAVGIGEALGVAHDAIERGVAALPGVPGRVERVTNDADLDIFVDYAHTPDALDNVLSALRPLTKRRLICVFGCGGDRDPTKRPKMGAAVVAHADLAIVTSDNPRTESPRAIIDQILPAVPQPFFVDVDRRVAIRAAIAEATPGDVVVIAGKGHEDYQIIGTTKHHFDDREEAQAAVLDRWRRSAFALADDVGGALRGDPETAITRVIIDSRIAAPGDCYVAIRGDSHDGHAHCAAAIRAGARAVIVDARDRTWAPVEPTLISPDYADLRSDGKLRAAVIVVDGDPATVPDATRRAIGAIARNHRQRWTGKLVAITGSAGKTTTKELARQALGAAGPTHGADGSLNNETGVPLTLLGLRPFHAFAVVEMGMRGRGQIEYLAQLAQPDVAVVVNAGTAHLELLGSTDAIAEAKSEIWLGLRPHGTVVRPVDDDRLAQWAKQHQPRARQVTFGDAAGADVQLVEYTPHDRGSRIVLDAFGIRRDLVLALVGRHVAIDACAALAAAHAAGVSLDDGLAGLARARPPAMRGEIVEVGGRRVIVDCYNANPASMAAALRALAERKGTAKPVAVLADMLELGDHAREAHRAAGALARELAIDVIALGDHAAALGERVESVAEAAARALARSQPGSWILLKASRGMKLERVLAAMREQTEG